jgi:hypothetical protein
MIDEVLYMEARLFSAFRQKYDISPIQANRLFEDYHIWDYIEECYGALHTSGDEYILDDIASMLEGQGVQLPTLARQ